MIDITDLTLTVEGRERPVLEHVDVHVPEGELVLVVGPTGSGKSTLLRSVNGLVPHFSGGRMSGRVVTGGRDTSVTRPRDLAETVGFVAQDPLSGFVTDTVEEELAYGMETLGVPATAMARRVEETLDLMGLAGLRRRTLTDLSGGQQQRVAIGAALAAGSRLLVLDEPTSALDPVAAEEVLSALHRLVNDIGMTVLLAEHRLERVIHHADSIVLVEGGRVRGPLDPAEAMALSPVFPPVVDLGRREGWSPLPLSVRDARRRAAGLRERLAAADRPRRRAMPASEAPTVTVRDVVVLRGAVRALDGVDLALHPGVTAVLGRNGSGKSTLLATLAGQLAPQHGQVRVAGLDPARTRPRELVRHLGMVPQDAAMLLYAETVAAECAAADKDFGAGPGTVRRLFERLAPGVADHTNPRDLSEGQRVCLALSLVLAAAPGIVLLDEPTRGLDYRAKTRLVEMLRALREQGRTVVVATHDVELAAEVADRAVLLGDGHVVADDDAHELLAGSPAFSPQVARVVAPEPFLTVAEVAEAGS